MKTSPVKAPADPEFRHPHNSSEKSDRVFWALREFQELAQLPTSIEPSRIVRRNLVNTISGQAIKIKQLWSIPERDAMAVLEQHHRLIHIFVGTDWRHVAVIDLGPAVPVCGTATPEHLMFECEGRKFGLLSIAGLWLGLGLASFANSSLARQFKADEVGMQYATLDVSISAHAGFVGFVSKGGGARMLFWRNDPLRLWRCDWRNGSLLDTVEITLQNSASFLASICAASACYATSNRCVYLADTRGGRILELNANDQNPRLVTIAGDGRLATPSRPVLGPAARTRLGQIRSLCEFRIQPAEAEILRGIIRRPRETSGGITQWIAKRTRNKPRGISLGTMLSDVSFLIAVMTNPDVAVSVSLPRNGNEALCELSSESRMVLPLVPFQVGDMTDGVADKDVSIDQCEVVSSPGISLACYKPGESTIQVVSTGFLAYVEKQAYDEESMRHLNDMSIGWPLS